MKRIHLLFAAAFLCLSGCTGGGSGDSGDNGGSAPPTPPTPPTPTTADITLLFMGNSHTLVNDVPGMVTAMMRAGIPGKTVAEAVAPGSMFLEERLHHVVTVNLMRSQDWSFVILQAQQYSSSGQFTYSTEEAKELVRISRQANAIPIMFPEWPRRGFDETDRIFDLHVSIAQATPACVAPIPQSFDLALSRHPALTLHASDGNHSAPAGAFLAALVMYATMSGRSPADLPNFSQFAVNAATQTELRGIAAETVQLVPPHQWCPGDSFP